MPSFEFDETKSQANLAKHGINFIDAQLLWQVPGLLEIPAKTEDEPRYLVIGLIHEKHWSAVIIYRDTNIRLISVRRSRIDEVTLYESERFR
ncbi:MAG: BrnT family toxin [Burkholderiales bacterium]